MRRVFFGFIMLFAAQSVFAKEENILLGEQAKIWYLTEFDSPTTPKEWIAGMDLNKLMEIAFEPILKSYVFHKGHRQRI